MMKHIKKVLSAVLVLCMVLSLVPISVFAAGTGTESGTDDFYKIVHLDCGRKYFTKDWIIALIDEMAAEGYNQLQLAVGNDGLRFLLDNMSFTANDTTYSHDSVVSAVESGNMSQNSSGDSRWLTQTEMDGIISAANAKNIEIVPLLNLPGHANTILDIAGDQFNYLTSQNTLDVTNDSAVNFAYALFTKYVDYFAGKGCSFFNFGADEFANDIYSNSFAGLNTTRYNSFVSFINKLAAYIESKGMTPRAFNDGLYYGSWTSVSIDTNIQCCYWSSGWSSYNVASAQAIADKGHKMINTNGDFYYVLGKSDQFDSGSSYAANWDNAKFMGTTFTSEQAGSMFCIWCDYPNAETETEIYTKVVTNGVLSAMSEAMGHMPETPEPDPTPADETVADGTTGVSVTAPGLTELTCNKVDTPAYSEEGASVVGYDITPYVGDVAYTESGTVSITVPDELKVFNSLKVYDVQEKKFLDSVKVANGVITFTAGHFSEYDIVGQAVEVTNYETITVTAGETDTRTINGANYAEQVDETDLNTSIATVVVTGTDATEATTTYTQASVTCNTLISSNSTNWTAVSGYYYKADDGNYYPVYAQRSSVKSGRTTTYTYIWGYSTTSSASNVTQIGTQSTTSTNTTPNITVYTRSGTDGTPASTEIIFTGVNPGTTSVIVGDTAYTIVVNYKTATVNVQPDGTTTVKVSGTLDASKLNPAIATVSIDNGTMTVTGVAIGETQVTVGNTIYTIKVAEEDLDEVTPLTIEYWITNGRALDGNGNKFYSVSAATVYFELGVDVSALLPANLTKEDTTRTLAYWHCRLLDKELSNSSTSGTEEQTGASGDDETYSGVAFTKVRYWNGTWAVYTENNEWVDVMEKHQLVAYYLEILPVADELTVNAADWGKKGDGSPSGDYLDPLSSCTVSIQVIYEDGTTNPATTTAADLMSSTIAYGYWSGGRGVGTLILTGLEGYQIWKIEAETGAMTYASSSSTWGSFTVSSFDWDNNAMTVYEGDPVDSYIIRNDSNNPSTSGYYANLMWDENYEAILITVYVKAVETEDSLGVHYIDQTANQEFYSYNIAVKSDILFNENIGLADPWKGNLANGSVVNTLGVTQTVSADLSTMPAIGTQYRFSSYTCVEVKRSDDGKDVYLYYTFDNTHNFVIDFGLPLKIDTTNLGLSAGDWTSVEVGNAIYGEVTDDISNRAIIYTPSVLPGVDSFTLTLIGSDKIPVTHTIYIYPATTVYYEEGFATYTGKWTDTGSKGTDTQEAEIPGAVGNNNYGYDAKYAGEAAGPSNGTQATSITIGDQADFTFTGTGVDIYANCTESSGTVSILIRDAGTNAIVKLLQVNTRTGAMGNATTGQDVDSYSLPIASINGLNHGTYNVTIKHSKTDADDLGKVVSLDGFRIYNTLALTNAAHSTDGVYYKDQEDDPIFIELRDEVLTAQNVDTTDSKYASQIAGQVYSTSDVTSAGAIILSTNAEFTANDLLDLLDNGPKNEIFLQSGQSLVFKITTKRVVQIGLKAIDSAVSCTVNGSEENISSSTDMFYTVLNKSSGDATEQIITITNTSSGDSILSVTLLKICDDPNAALGTLTAEDLIPALVSLGFEADPEESAEPEPPAEPTQPAQPSKPGKPSKPGQVETVTADATLKVTVGNASVTLTKTGEKGKTATFTAAEIEKAANSLLANGYALKNAQFKDVTVTYGKSATVRFTAVRAQQVSAPNFGGRR